MNRAPYVRMKDYDHEDVEAELRADRTLVIIANILASIGVFAVLMFAIAIVAQVPESWLSWIVLALGGV
ncbi:MAG: hypothetical protein IPN06_20130 [Burkholderiales bacterium]|nr:hypothetical protein [Burkholderiales bacterium]